MGIIMRMAVETRIANLIGVTERQVVTTVALLDEGATVPFIARYRKEVTGGLDDGQLRLLTEKLAYYRELDNRRDTILESIASQGKLTDELRAQIETVDTRVALEDLYLPYKPKRRTKAQIAREAGLEPLVDLLIGHPETVPETAATDFIDAEKGIVDVKAALEGARQILIERISEKAVLVGRLRELLAASAVLASKVIEGQEAVGSKFLDYFDSVEKLDRIASHRVLAMLRGQAEGILRLSLLPRMSEEGDDSQTPHRPFVAEVARSVGIADQGRAADAWLCETARQAWRLKLFIKLEIELINDLRDRANSEAILVFSNNLRDLLLAAPAGEKVTLGLDPGYRAGVKVAVIDATGKLVDTATIYPHEPKSDWQGSLAKLAVLCKSHGVELVAIGNGTASRETEALVTDLIATNPDLNLTKVVVSESGASVYSASELAAEEFPDLDVTLRGAASIARRLQDPLAELVKIDPKSIGVGQYQHDLPQTQLSAALDGTVEDCVNAVGVDVNTASKALLTRISGLSRSLAEAIVTFRDKNGRFNDRSELKKVPRLGDRAFEQAAGFLRIRDGANPLDGSSVHPEAYPVVEKILADVKLPIGSVIGNSALLRKLSPERYTDERFGLPTVTDIINELDKPGRDPRGVFETARFDSAISKLTDLKVGMILEGQVTNVANFGAFVDVGVHQDGLVHISELADRFVADPRTVVRVGQVVKVRVVEVDVGRKRIALSMRSERPNEPRVKDGAGKPNKLSKKQQSATKSPLPADTAMATAFAKLRRQL